MTPPIDGASGALVHPERRRLLLAVADLNPQPSRSFDDPDHSHGARDESEAVLQSKLRHARLLVFEQAEFIVWDRDDRQITRGRTSRRFGR